MADIRINVDDLDNRASLAEKQHAHLANPTQPLRTTRSRQREDDPTLNPLRPNIMTTAQVLMGATTQITPTELAKAHMTVAAEGVLRIFDEGNTSSTGGQADPGDLYIPKGDTGGASTVIALARAEVGYIEGAGNQNKYAEIAGHSNGLAWCVTFIDAIFTMAGMKDKVVVDASTENTRDRAIEAGRWGTTPQLGAVVFFNFRGPSRNVSHVEIVIGVEGDKLITIGGNTSSGSSGSQDNGDGVFQRTRRVSDAVGYYYPEYPSEEDQLEAARLKPGSYT